MTHDPASDARFDARLRALHQRSLQHLGPATRLRLRDARPSPGAAPVRRGLAWALGSATVAVAVAGLALRFQPGPPLPSPALLTASRMAAPPAEPLAMLDESPDLYLFLASADAGTSPMEF